MFPSQASNLRTKFREMPIVNLCSKPSDALVLKYFHIRSPESEARPTQLHVACERLGGRGGDRRRERQMSSESSRGNCRTVSHVHIRSGRDDPDPTTAQSLRTQKCVQVRQITISQEMNNIFVTLLSTRRNDIKRSSWSIFEKVRLTATSTFRLPAHPCGSCYLNGIYHS